MAEWTRPPRVSSTVVVRSGIPNRHTFDDLKGSQIPNRSALGDLILLLGASSYVGRRMFGVLGPSKAIGTHRNNPVPGAVFFDATRMRLSDVVSVDSRVSHAVIFYAETKIDACKADLRRSYEINVRSVKSIIDELTQNEIKPVFISSEYVFDGKKGRYVEEDKPNPITVYGSQKLEVEQYLAHTCEDFTILRLAKVFGTRPGDGMILANWLKQITNGDEIRCAYDQIFSPIHVDDVVTSIIRLIQLNLSGVFHLSNTEHCSRLEMLRTLLDCLTTDARVIECSIRDFDFVDRRPLDLSMNPRKLFDAT